MAKKDSSAPLSVVILAAGQGKRMKSDLPKVLQPVAGRPLLKHVIDAARALQPAAMYVVYGHGGDRVRETLKGEQVFRNYCSACHGADGYGDGPVSSALKSPAPNLTRLSERNGGSFPIIHVRNMISFGGDEFPAHGSRQMPIWGPIFHEIEFDRDFGNVRTENVVKYLMSIQHK